MSFRDFYKFEESFLFEGVQITIKELPLANHERILMERMDANTLNFIKSSLKQFADKVLSTNEPTQPLKKFKVNLRYPKTRKGKTLGHYIPDNLYIFADNPGEARQKAIEFLRNKLEPIENDEQRRFPRHNYLNDLKTKDMNVKVSQVKSWKDFVEMLGVVGRKNGYIWDHFDERDLKMILNQSKKKNFEQELSLLDPTQLKMLKKVYFTLAQDPYLDDETRKLLDHDFASKLRSAKSKMMPQGKDVPKKDWPYWSIFEPKNSDEEFKAMSNLHTVKDIKNAAARYGIPANHLRDMFKMEFEVDTERYRDEIRLYRHVWQDILDSGIKPREIRKIFETGDYETAQKRGVKWDEMVHSLMNNQEYYFPYKNPEDYTKAADWLWTFIQQKPSRKPLTSYYHDALIKLLDQRDKRGKTDVVPF